MVLTANEQAEFGIENNPITVAHRRKLRDFLLKSWVNPSGCERPGGADRPADGGIRLCG